MQALLLLFCFVVPATKRYSQLAHNVTLLQTLRFGLCRAPVTQHIHSQFIVRVCIALYAVGHAEGQTRLAAAKHAPTCARLFPGVHSHTQTHKLCHHTLGSLDCTQLIDGNPHTDHPL